jgi:hypothetical protein
VEQEGFVGRTECERCFPVRLATPPSTPEPGEAGGEIRQLTPSRPGQTTINPRDGGSRGWGVEWMETIVL